MPGQEDVLLANVVPRSRVLVARPSQTERVRTARATRPDALAMYQAIGRVREECVHPIRSRGSGCVRVRSAELERSVVGRDDERDRARAGTRAVPASRPGSRLRARWRRPRRRWASGPATVTASGPAVAGAPVGVDQVVERRPGARSGGGLGRRWRPGPGELRRVQSGGCSRGGGGRRPRPARRLLGGGPAEREVPAEVDETAGQPGPRRRHRRERARAEKSLPIPPRSTAAPASSGRGRRRVPPRSLRPRASPRRCGAHVARAPRTYGHTRRRRARGGRWGRSGRRSLARAHRRASARRVARPPPPTPRRPR